jgi:predicted RNA-binding Zn-ribbon protein involved in translation (DUF1610 family)
MPHQTHTRILHNRIRCTSCDTILESTSRHDFKRCECGNVAIDGGREYIRRIGTTWEELSEYTPNPTMNDALARAAEASKKK